MSFEDLVTQHHVMLRSFIRSLGIESDWVDDMAQEAFLIAYKEMEQFDVEQDFAKWLRGIARNIVRNEIRKRSRRRIIDLRLSELLLNDSEQQQPIRCTELAALRQCVEQLSRKSRELVSGRYYDGWKSEELADRVGMTAAAVRQALVRIRRQLRSCVEQFPEATS